jgi:hypothetical protein
VRPVRRQVVWIATAFEVGSGWHPGGVLPVGRRRRPRNHGRQGTRGQPRRCSYRRQCRRAGPLARARRRGREGRRARGVRPRQAVLSGLSTPNSCWRTPTWSSRVTGYFICGIASAADRHSARARLVLGSRITSARGLLRSRAPRCLHAEQLKASRRTPCQRYVYRRLRSRANSVTA